jgi:hypothetical protein
MNELELQANKKEFNNSQDMLKDLLQGDPYAFKKLESMNLDMKAIKLALDTLTSRPGLDDKDKYSLLSESWRVAFRDRPPTPEEFLTEKYIGPTAKTIYPRIRKIFLDFMDPTQQARNLVLFPFIGFGKLSYYEEKIMTPRGYKKAKDIQIGDEVSTPNGKKAKVINVRDYPEASIYKVTFGDNRAAYVGGPHYWKAARTYTPEYWDKKNKKYVKYPKGERRPNWKIITTEKLLEDMNTHPEKNRGWFIPICNKVEHTEKEHLISPYMLGALLGDGSLHKQISIGNDDKEILERIIKESQNKPWKIIFTDYTEKKELKSSVNYKILFTEAGKLKEELERLGLANTYSNTKFIPDEYKYDSIENRIQLLQGLMDTGGNVLNKKKSPKASYYTNSEKLKDDIIELCAGLGASRCTSSKNKKGTYRVDITFPDNSFPIFYLQRKQHYIDEEYLKDKSQYKKQNKPKVLHIKSIEKTNLKGGKCIEIDDEERLYLTSNYIVTHNSFLSTLITLYISVCVSLMRNPYKYFGLSPATLLAQMLISYSIKKSKELLLDPFLNIMEASPFFEKVNRKDTMKQLKAEFEMRDRVDKLYFTTADPTSELMFDSGLAIKCASSVQSLLGLSLISIVLSELSFFRDAGKSDDYILRIYNDSKGRIYSRMKGNYYGVSVLDSSPNSLTSPLESWVWYDAANDPSYYVVKGSIWKWNPEDYAKDFETGDTFKIFTGGKGQVPRILDPLDPMLSDPLADQSKIIEVPAKGPDGKMRSYFEEDLIKSLKDFAGIPAGAADSLITDYQVIEDMFDNNLKNIYLNITAPANESPKRLIWNQIKDTFFKNIAGKYEYYYLPHVARCISVDQSEVTDVTSISMAHVERDKESAEIMYVIDFTIAIVPDSNRVNLAAIEEFIRDLRYLGNMTIAKVSFDRFQSSVTIQNLKRDKFDVENLSVDRTTGPYLNLLSLLNRRRIVCGKNIFFKNNLKSLILSHTKGNNNTKIDHDSSSAQVLVGDPDWDTSFIGYYGKDVSDSVAAVCELCTSEFPVAQVNWEPASIKERSLAQENKEEATTKVNDFLKKFGLK